MIVWGFYFIQYFTVYKLRCSFFNIFKICTLTYHSIKIITFSLRCFIEIGHNNFFDIPFPLWFDWRTQVSSKMFYGTTWIAFPSRNSNIFLALHFCLSHRLPHLLQMPGVNCLRLNLLYGTAWRQWGLEHWNDTLHWTIKLSPLNPLRLLLLKFDKGLPSFKDSKCFSGLNGTLKMTLPSISYGNCFTCLTGVFFSVRLFHINFPGFTTRNRGVLLTLARKTIVQVNQFRGIRLNTGWLTIGWPIGRYIRPIVNKKISSCTVTFTGW